MAAPSPADKQRLMHWELCFADVLLKRGGFDLILGNPLSKVVSRSLKREVTEGRVQREAVVIHARMSEAESAFYTAVTKKIRDYCAEMEVSEGFMLTIPQKQISSSMAAACQGWHGRVALDRDMKFIDDRG